MTQPYSPTLHRFPDDTSGRFAVIREFLVRWHGLDTGTVGRTVPRVDEAEANAGEALPLAVREWIVLLDDLNRIGGWGLVLRDCWGLRRVPGCPAFSLLTAGEDDCHWGPFLRDLGEEDPPTHQFYRDYEGDESTFRHGAQVAARASTWAIEFILSYLRLSRSVHVALTASQPTLARMGKQAPVAAAKLGETELFEFEGGLIHAVPRERGLYTLRCYAPHVGATTDDYYRAAGELQRRVEAMLGVTRI